MMVTNKQGIIKKFLAINEVSILRQSRQAASMSISVGSRVIIKKLISDGFEIPKKYQNLFELNQSVVPNDITLLINNNEIGLVLLRIAEFIGEDKLQDIGPETVYFMISILNKLNLDKIRNEIILKVLPLKI